VDSENTEAVPTRPLGADLPEPEPTFGSLAKALAAAQGEFPVVTKGKTAKAGANYSFAYATMADYAAECYPILAKHGLAFTCLPNWLPERGFHMVARLLHTSGEHIEGVLPLSGTKAQEIGASMSYARRQLFTALTGATADDETSAEKANAQTAERAQNPNARKSTKKKAASAAAPVSAGAVIPDPWADGAREYESGGRRINSGQTAAMHGLFKEIGVESREDRLEKTSAIVGRLVSSSTELSHDEAATLLDALTRRRDDLVAAGEIAKPEVGPCSMCSGINGEHSRTCPAGSKGAH
jgi:hypothetical protein